MYAINIGHRNLYVAMKKKSETNKNIMLIQVQTASICRRLSIGIPLIGAQRTWLVGFDTFSLGVCGGSDATSVSDDEFIVSVYMMEMNGRYICVLSKKDKDKAKKDKRELISAKSFIYIYNTV